MSDNTGIKESAAPGSGPHPLRRGLLKAIGPGILLAGAAIGVSHLVQATRAGAEFHFALLPLLLIACATKYPFLEFGPRYAAATGETLIEGYRRLGKWALWTSLVVTAGSMFIVMAGVTIVTAALADRVINLVIRADMPPAAWSAAVIAACMFLLMVGRYAALDRTMKIVMSILLLSTIAALVMAIAAPTMSPPTDVAPPQWWTLGTFAFILAFMGWMPIPIDASIWHSIWTQERGRQTGHLPTMQQARFDFNTGYLLATIVAVIFLALGALVMFGRSDELEGGGAFVARFISMYGETLGPWSIPLIVVAGFTTMFSTTLVVLDAFPRVMQRITATLRGEVPQRRSARRHYASWVIAQACVAMVILMMFDGQLTRLVDIATTLSFLTAPVFAFINYRVVTGPHMPAHARPGPAMRRFSIASIVFLALFSAVYLVWRVGV